MQGCIFTAFLAIAGCATAASTAPAPEGAGLPNNPVPKTGDPLNACTRWSRPLHAHLSHLSVSEDGRRILVSTSGERRGDARLRALDSRGKALWSHDLEQPVKAQTLSPDGRLALVNTYDGKLTAYDAGTGARLWDHDHLGRPVVLPKSRRILLFNDDDSEPRTAFVTYDYKGRLIATVTVDHESLEMDVADDESFVAITTTDRRVLAHRADGALLWQGRLPGDPVSVKATGGGLPHIHVLTVNPKNKGEQSLSSFLLRSSEGAPAWTVPLERRYEAIRSVGGSILMYGNNHLGQALAAYHAETGALLWRHSYPTPAVYSSLVFSGPTPAHFMTVAIDEGAPAGILHVLAVKPDGTSQWDAPIEAGSGLYSYALAGQGPALVAGAGEPGDGVVDYVSFTRRPCPRRPD